MNYSFRKTFTHIFACMRHLVLLRFACMLFVMVALFETTVAQTTVANVNGTIFIMASPYNAKCDLLKPGGTLTVNTSGVTSGVTFLSTDVGKTINGGGFVSGTWVVFSGVIASVTAGNATLASGAPSSTVTTTTWYYGHDDQIAIQAALTAAESANAPVQLPPGACLTSSLVWHGQSIFGAGISLSTLQGMPGQDVLATPDTPTIWSIPQNGVLVHDFTVNVDASVNAAATAAGGNNNFPNRISGTAGGSTPLSSPPAPGPVTISPSDACGAYINDGVHSTSLSTLYTTCGGFQAIPSQYVIGAQVTVIGAGPSGGNLNATITAITGANTVTISPAASTGISNGSGSWGAGVIAPWYVGNCAFAAPDSNASTGVGNQGLNHWYWEHINIQAVDQPANRANNTCGIFLQAASNKLGFRHMIVTNLWGGIIEALPAAGLGSLTAWTPDTNDYEDVNLQFNLIPMVWYNGAHRIVNGLSIYAGGLQPFSLGLFQFNVPIGISSTPSATFNRYYDECWTPNSGEHARYTGVNNVIDGGVLGQCGSAGGMYINWATSQGFSSAAIGPNFRINGSHNTFLNSNLLPSQVTNNGPANEIEGGTSGSNPNLFRRAYAQPDAPFPPAGFGDGSSALSGNSATPYRSSAGLVVKADDLFGTLNSSLISSGIFKYVVDNGLETYGSYLDVAGTQYIPGQGGEQIGANIFFLLGTRWPTTSGYLVTQGMCEGAASCSATFTVRDITTSTNLGSCTETYNVQYNAATYSSQVWSISGAPGTATACPINLTNATPGDEFGVFTSTWSGTGLSGYRVGYIMFVPANTDVASELSSVFGKVLSATTSSIGGASVSAGACASGTVSITGATTSMVAAASPNTNPGSAFTWNAQVTSPGTVTVYVCTNLAGGGTPAASTYNVRVIE
ncbi:hypothetical protein [Terriglobus albidus]|uniref:hypothetical protein n=1 Tax=Terriglobus albidus TaxID=1592106 RepID=UPI0021E00E37|nr:hypothetical protein [Terriglobus albidus]